MRKEVVTSPQVRHTDKTHRRNAQKQPAVRGEGDIFVSAYAQVRCRRLCIPAAGYGSCLRGVSERGYVTGQALAAEPRPAFCYFAALRLTGYQL